MIVSFECSGGFANLRLSFEGDTREMTEERARDLERAVAESGMLTRSSPPPTGPSRPVADAIDYRVTVSTAGKGVTWKVTDVTMPREMRPLVTLLKKLAIEQRKSGEQGGGRW